MNTKNISNMNVMFYECSTLISLPDLSKWNTKNVIDINCMFFKCSSLISLPDISKWDTKYIDLYEMFKGCHNLLNSHH